MGRKNEKVNMSRICIVSYFAVGAQNFCDVGKVTGHISQAQAIKPVKRNGITKKQQSPNPNIKCNVLSSHNSSTEFIVLIRYYKLKNYSGYPILDGNCFCFYVSKSFL